MQPFTRITESIKYSKISGFKLCYKNRFARVQINYVALGGDGINKYFFDMAVSAVQAVCDRRWCVTKGMLVKIK